MFKKVIALMVAFVMLLSILPLTVSANGEPPEVVAYGELGYGGAPWRLYSDGTVIVDSGTIIESWQPWQEYQNFINKIVFTGQIDAGTSVRGLFQELYNLIDIKGLDFFDTSNVTNMDAAFSHAENLSSIDLSSWNVSSVESMLAVFRGTNSLVELNLSGWDVRNVEHMYVMFAGTSLRQLTLGENFRFVDSSYAALPNPPNNEYFTGLWQHVGSGFVSNPNGVVFTADELMANYDGSNPAHVGTWVWQPRDRAIPIPNSIWVEVGDNNVFVVHDGIHNLEPLANPLIILAIFDGGRMVDMEVIRLHDIITNNTTRPMKDGDLEVFLWECWHTMTPIDFVLLVTDLPPEGQQRLGIIPWSYIYNLNGVDSKMDAPAMYENGRLLVPARMIAETIAQTVEWNTETEIIIIEANDTRIELQIGSYTMTVNGNVIDIDVPARIIDGLTFVPARAIFEAFGAVVSPPGAHWGYSITWVNL